jgi:hypothetical protein
MKGESKMLKDNKKVGGGWNLNLYGVILSSILLISIAVISNNASTGEPTKNQMRAFEEFNRRNGGNWKADWNDVLGNPIAVFVLDGKYTKKKPIPDHFLRV